MWLVWEICMQHTLKQWFCVDHTMKTQFISKTLTHREITILSQTHNAKSNGLLHHVSTPRRPVRRRSGGWCGVLESWHTQIERRVLPQVVPRIGPTCLRSCAGENKVLDCHQD